MVDLLKELGFELGLQAVGVAAPTGEVLKAYPWARSVVCCAISYLPPDPSPNPSPKAGGGLRADLSPGPSPEARGGLRGDPSPDPSPSFDELRMAGGESTPGLVARFARGTDYHVVLRGKLERLAKAIRKAHPDARTEVCVDTNPLPERKLAVLAGIAWRGWNGNVFVDGCGSWASLGEIVTDFALPGSKPLTIDRCWDCGRCMRMCPIRAITEPYVVDRSRCISQLTQVAGTIPVEMREAVGNRVYGCDICQEVCPQNMGVKPITHEFAGDRFPGASPDLIPLIGLTASDYRRYVKGSSIGWIRRTRIRRNAAVAAGNMRAKAAIPALEAMTKDPDPVLRECAEWALERIG